jgi:hypothetical protein
MTLIVSKTSWGITAVSSTSTGASGTRFAVFGSVVGKIEAVIFTFGLFLCRFPNISRMQKENQRIYLTIELMGYIPASLGSALSFASSSIYLSGAASLC